MAATTPVLVFDGDCGFCTHSARWAQTRFGLEHVQPWQALDLAEYGLTEQQCQSAVQWVDADGTASSGHEAVAAVLNQGGPAARAIGRIGLLPGVSTLAALAYRGVARIRHRLPGATDACRINQ